MRLRLLTPLLPLVLFGSLGCTKKTDPGPVMNTGSYQIAGRPKTCSATAFTTVTPGAQTTTTVLLATVPQPANGPEVLTLSFVKAPGQPATAYKIDFIAIGSNGNVSTSFSVLTATLTSTGNTLSGTFAARGTTASFDPADGITNGVFTNVQL